MCVDFSEKLYLCLSIFWTYVYNVYIVVLDSQSFSVVGMDATYPVVIYIFVVFPGNSNLVQYVQSINKTCVNTG